MLLYLVSILFLASSNTIESCEVSEEIRGEKVQFDIQVVTEQVAGESRTVGIMSETLSSGILETSRDESVEIIEGEIRENIASVFPPISDAEDYVLLAMMMEFYGLESGLELNKVRRVKIYKFTNDLAVIVAFDSSGQPLGRFLGGALLAACKN